MVTGDGRTPRRTRIPFGTGVGGGGGGWGG